MKRYFYIASAAALLVAGCAKEAEPETPFAVQAEEVILDITMEDCLVDGSEYATPDTKTVVKNTKEIWWESGDAVSIYPSNSTTPDKFTSKLASGKTAKTSQFSGTFSKSASSYIVFYPYTNIETASGALKTALPAVQTARAGSFDKNLMFALGSFAASKPGFTLKPMMGGLKFRLSRTDIKTVTVFANDGSYLAGDVKFYGLASSSPGISQFSTSSRTISLSPSSGAFQSGVDYFIVMIPGTLEKGITIQLTTTAGKVLEAKSTKSISVKKGVFGSFAKPLNEYVSTATPTAVDLGLSVKWASFNVGATTPEGSGFFYAWGETVTKPYYNDWKSYKWCEGTKNTLTKYNTNSSYGKVDNKTKFSDYSYADDPARYVFGGKWRVPTNDEWNELINNCTWTWTTVNGVSGCKVTSKKSGYTSKYIFIPAAGYFTYNSVKNENTDSAYMLEVISSTPYLTMSFSVNQEYLGHFSGNNDRTMGRTVRAVQSK
ncbi:MAG: hypothetical protein J5695_03280 [Bacteroidales bacterium]|nr:hypothetical protein [Bacteroidales bacterium]